MRKKFTLVLALTVFLTLSCLVFEAGAYVIDFEGFSDSTALANQYSAYGLTFSGATVITAGISLNELEFPPLSGSNVAYDASGPISIDFSTPVREVGAYVTYSTPVTFSYYDASDNLLGSVHSAFTATNMAISGDSGSTPNEYFYFANNDISRITIAGDTLGASFVMDDLEVASSTVPEPSSLLFLTIALIVLSAAKYEMQRRRV